MTMNVKTKHSVIKNIKV